MNLIQQHLLRLADEYIAAYQQKHQSLPMTDFDTQWLSLCQQSSPNGWQEIAWRPVPQDPSIDFSDLEHALEVDLHPDFKDYFGCIWSEHLDMCYQDQKPLQLIFLWNLDDYQRLKENVIGHWLSKKRLKQAPSLFFAVIDDERFISIDNQSGEIYLETLGRKPEIIQSNLLNFLQQLTPHVAD